MLLLFFRNCCRILWKPLKVQQHQSDHQQRPYRLPQHQFMIWIFLLFLLSQQNGSHCRPAEKWNHRIQRRFMWKQMDNTMDGIVERVVSGARVMKGMIGEFMPAKQNNVMDYLPTETTRVRYIIRNPHTKETKVIKMRPSKKVVKIMAITPRPLMSSAEKTKSLPYNSLNPEKLRQMEKEQELIAEGKMPQKHEHEYSPMYMALKSEKPKETSKKNIPLAPSQSDDDVVSGSISEFDDSWKPLAPSGFSTTKPMAMSALHTGVIDELLPLPEKQVYEPLQQQESNEYAEHEPTKSHTYEVTEYTAEESVVQPYTHDYYTYRNAPLTSLTLRGAHRFSPVSETQNNESPKAVENSPSQKHYVPGYTAQRGFVPSRSSYKSQQETTTAAPTTSTTEEPNYPSSFLRKYRERAENQYHHTKATSRHKQTEISVENNWQPSNISYSNQSKYPPSARHHHPYQYSSSIGTRIKSQKWPPEVEETQNIASSYDVPVTTDSPPSSLQELTTYAPSSLSSSLRSSTNARKNVRLKSNTTALTTFIASSLSDNTESQHNHQHPNNHHHSHFQPHQQYHKPRNVRQRGSIRYGDKLIPEDG